MGLSQLTPAQRFMFEYGCFVSFWGNFEMYMEVVIWHLTNDDPIENCRKINKKTAGGKRKVLYHLLHKAGRQDVIDALDQVFDVAERNDWVAERNDWIHGTILNPDGNFSRLTRFRVYYDKDSILVENSILDLDISRFDEFYPAYDKFKNVVENTFGVSVSVCNDYIKKLQEDNGN